MQIPIDGRSYDVNASFNPGNGDHAPRGITLQMKGTDGALHETIILDTTHGVHQFARTGDRPHLEPVVNWFRKTMLTGWIDLGNFSVKSCPKCAGIISATRVQRESGEDAPCPNKDCVP